MKARRFTYACENYQHTVSARETKQRAIHWSVCDATRVSKTIMTTVEPFLDRTRIAYFSMEIAMQAEIHTNLSVLDGWWVEGHVEDVTGWALATAVPRPMTQEAKRELAKISAPSPANASGARRSTSALPR
jgi:hypothetical protein